MEHLGNKDTDNELLKKIAHDVETNIPFDNGQGYTALMNDVSQLVYDAYTHEFDDFKNTKFAFPKRELVERLEGIIKNVKDGKYDN
jgi:hypothetical protein